MTNPAESSAHSPAEGRASVAAHDAPSPTPLDLEGVETRETIARIIDPTGWEKYDRVAEYQSRPQGEAPWSQSWHDLAWEAKRRSDVSLAKVDQILAALRYDPTEREDEGIPCRPVVARDHSLAITEAEPSGAEAERVGRAVLAQQSTDLANAPLEDMVWCFGCAALDAVWGPISEDASAELRAFHTSWGQLDRAPLPTPPGEGR